MAEQAEVLHAGQAVSVTRCRLAAAPHGVVIKRAAGNAALRRLAHEAAMLRRLTHITGVSRVVAVPNPDTLHLQDDGSVALGRFLQAHSLSLIRAVEYAGAVARIVAEVHAAGMLHLDICPANLLIDPHTHAATLIDFGSALLTAQAGRDAPQDSAIARTWAYMSPEHTGRSGRAPDQRSDLYSLGVTLYELFTGAKPFGSEDLLELIHDHLVRVPTAPAEVDRGVPRILSSLVMRLLEKEPDRRYQSAAGLAHDLQRVHAALCRGELPAFELGELDFGARLQPPAQLVGRTAELAALRAWVAAGAQSKQRCLLVVGPPGVGKSALLERLRPMVAAQRGWFVYGRFDQYRPDTHDGALDALQALGRQLLAEPQDVLEHYRERIREGLGSNLGVGPALLPEFQLLLGAHPAADLTDAREAEARTAQAALDVLRSVASSDRPLVLVYDDAHWASSVSRRLLDLVVTDPAPIPGLLLICAYRDSEVVDAHPLRTLVEGWRRLGLPPAVMALEALAPAAAEEFIGMMLRMPPQDASRLAAVLFERTGHNPYNTIELLNALRQDRLLVVNAGGWVWNAPAIRRHVGNSSVADILSRRVGKLPAEARELLEALACLGGQLRLADLALATGLDHAQLQQRLEPSLNDGLLAGPDAEQPLLRFSNPRVQQAVLEGIAEQQRSRSHLALARRLAQRGGNTAIDALAAEQYLAACTELSDPQERRRALNMFERAAQRARLLNGAVAERYLAAARELLESIATPADGPQLYALTAEHHRALFNLGRLQESDTLYEWLAAHAPTPVALAVSTRIQMYALSNRRRFADSLALGMDLLRQMGLEKPADVSADIAAGFQRLAQWSRSAEKQRDLTCPEASDPQVLAWSQIIPECTTAAYFCDMTTWAWLNLEALRQWIDHGPSSRLMVSFGAAPTLLAGGPQDFRGAYDVARHVLRVGEMRGYEPTTSFMRVMFALSAAHWVEPIESAAAEFFSARADLVRMGDESFFAFTFVVADHVFDYAPALDAALLEVDAGLAVAARSANIAFSMRLQPRKQMLLALRGATRTPGGFDTDSFEEAAYRQSIESNGPAATTYHTMRALTALFFGDIPKLIEHAAQIIPLAVRTPGYYFLAIGRVLQAVASSERARSLPVPERAALIAELDSTCVQWLAARAAEAPVNFLHLLRWVEAERAWAAGSTWATGAAFDAAVAEAALHARPWHRAIINERAALFHLELGLQDSARPLLVTACEIYESWGASGKVQQLRHTHACLRSSAGRLRAAAAQLTTAADQEEVDLVAVLRASQALSSETSLVRLTEQVARIVSTLTGATAVRLVVRAEAGNQAWIMSDSLGKPGTPLSVEEAGARGELPLSVFRYVERTCELQVIDDVSTDDRCASDAYGHQFDACSLLFAPILKQGTLVAVLVLENNQRRAAFTAQRLDSVAMIAGQLAVSLDNALLYASLERRVCERTAQLRRRTDDINAMLQNLPQGVLSIVGNGTVHPEYSAHLATILGHHDIAQRSIIELLFAASSLSADVIDQLAAAIGACIGEDQMNYGFNAHLLVTELDKTLPDGRVRSLALSWAPICDPQGTVERLMLCVRDVTDLKRLAGEASARQRELQMIGEIVAVAQDKFHAFIESARGCLAANRTLLQAGIELCADTARQLFRNLHTLKGNARTYGLLQLSNLVHQAEQSYEALRHGQCAGWDRALLSNELAALSESLETYAHVNDSVLGRRGPGRRGDAARFLMVERAAVQAGLRTLLNVDQRSTAAMRGALAQVTQVICTIGTERAEALLEAPLAGLPSLARELGKEPPVVVIEDHGIALRTQVSGVLRDVFTHLLRNAVDHGIELPQARCAQGKPPAGRIQLQLAVQQDRLWMRLRDDGRGLALSEIHRRALEQGLVKADEPLSRAAVAQLVLRAGVSTAAAVTEVSGRGVGLDAVAALLADHGGSIEIRLLGAENPGGFSPFETVISLPDKYAASLSAEMSQEALWAQLQLAVAL